MPPTLTLTVTSDGLAIIKNPKRSFNVGPPKNKVQITVINEDETSEHQIRFENITYRGNGMPFDPLTGEKVWILFPAPYSKTTSHIVKDDAWKEPHGSKDPSYYDYSAFLDSTPFDPEIVVDPASLVSSSEMMMRRAPARKQAKKKPAGARKKSAPKRKTAAKKKSAPKRGARKTVKKRATRKKR